MIILSIILIVISGISKAICDVSSINGQQDKLYTWGNLWWRKSISSNNKYKNRDPKQGPAFFGSTTFLVWLTDAWHLFDFLRDLSIAVAMFLCPEIWVLIGEYALKQVIFEFTFRWLRIPYK